MLLLTVVNALNLPTSQAYHLHWKRQINHGKI